MTHRDQLLKPTADVITAALQRTCALIEQGHCKGQAHNVIEDRDCWCLMAALTRSCGTVRVSDTAVIPGKLILDAATAALKIAMSTRWSGSLAEFNDLSETDAVVNLCLRAIGLVQRSAA